MSAASGKQLAYLYDLRRRLERGDADQKALADTIRRASNKVRGLSTADASDYIDHARKALGL